MFSNLLRFNEPVFLEIAFLKHASTHQTVSVRLRSGLKERLKFNVIYLVIINSSALCFVANFSKTEINTYDYNRDLTLKSVSA